MEPRRQQTFTVGPLGSLQLDLATNMGITNFTGGSVLVSCSTPGCQVAAYASIIDAATAESKDNPGTVRFTS
jgi:hypothetical protein